MSANTQANNKILTRNLVIVKAELANLKRRYGELEERLASTKKELAKTKDELEEAQETIDSQANDVALAKAVKSSESPAAVNQLKSLQIKMVPENAEDISSRDLVWQDTKTKETDAVIKSIVLETIEVTDSATNTTSTIQELKVAFDFQHANIIDPNDESFSPLKFSQNQIIVVKTVEEQGTCQNAKLQTLNIGGTDANVWLTDTNPPSIGTAVSGQKCKISFEVQSNALLFTLSVPVDTVIPLEIKQPGEEEDKEEEEDENQGQEVTSSIAESITVGNRDYGNSAPDNQGNTTSQNSNQDKLELSITEESNGVRTINLTGNVDDLAKWHSIVPSQATDPHQWFAVEFAFSGTVISDKIKFILSSGNGNNMYTGPNAADDDAKNIMTLWLKIDEENTKGRIITLIKEPETEEEKATIEIYQIAINGKTKPSKQDAQQ